VGDDIKNDVANDIGHDVRDVRQKFGYIMWFILICSWVHSYFYFIFWKSHIHWPINIFFGILSISQWKHLSWTPTCKIETNVFPNWAFPLVAWNFYLQKILSQFLAWANGRAIDWTRKEKKKKKLPQTRTIEKSCTYHECMLSLPILENGKKRLQMQIQVLKFVRL
jgi:hypothetical protein